MNYAEYIEINAEKRFGKPIIIGTRISVYDVLSWLANGMSIPDIIDDFPELNADQIKACLLYAADKEHKLKIVSLTFCLTKIFRLGLLRLFLKNLVTLNKLSNLG